MGEGDEVSDEFRERVAREGKSTAEYRYGSGWLQKWIEKHMDVAINLTGGDTKDNSFEKDENEETPEEEKRRFETERSTSRMADVTDTAPQELFRPFKSEILTKKESVDDDEEHRKRRQNETEEDEDDDDDDQDIVMGRE